MGNTLFTFEELATALTQIEACLNSKPLSLMFTDPADLEPLIPAHFLVGGPLTSVPDIDVTDVCVCYNESTNSLAIDSACSSGFLETVGGRISLRGLQGRTKWKIPQDNLKIDDLVIIREEHLPPLKWKLGRVVELHSGSDNLVRVVSIRTANGIVKRAIHKLCRLPVDSDI